MKASATVVLSRSSDLSSQLPDGRYRADRRSFKGKLTLGGIESAWLSTYAHGIELCCTLD